MDLKMQFLAMQAAHSGNRYPSLCERKNWLLTLKKALQKDAQTLAAAINKDFTHRSVEESLFLEIFPTIQAIHFCLGNMKRWMKDRRRKVSWLMQPAHAYLSPQPLGVVGNISPWNYPLYLSLVPAIYALAAGNKVMIKMSELSPNTGLALQTLIQSIGLEKQLVIVTGGVDIAKEFATLPFGHLLFTGSSKVGKQVMRAASDNLTPVTLELGGKSPAILSKTMNPAYFKRLFMGKLFNAAQTCVAPDYLLIPTGWENKIEVEFKNFINLHYPQLMANADYTSIISASHKQRLMNLVEDARAKGARVVVFGESTDDSSKMPMYLLFDVSNDMQVMKEEIFGPVLPVCSYNNISQAIDIINADTNPLALYYFGEDKDEIELIKKTTLSGALTINDTIMQVAIDDLPFGGVGHSGMGRYHGQEGFDSFSQLKPVMVQRRLSPISFMYPPYGKFFQFFLSKIGGIK